eukprot:1351209-Amphidinium_carterae.1
MYLLVAKAATKVQSMGLVLVGRTNASSETTLSKLLTISPLPFTSHPYTVQQLRTDHAHHMPTNFKEEN